MTEHALDRLARDQHEGRAVGITSVCSAHPVVLDETVRHGAAGDHIVLIEATCNQVNQDGGYTGLQPADFRRQVEALASARGLSASQLVLGGDHLGPNPWKHLPAETAMAKSEDLVHAFVSAGFSKIHLDTSIRCADDPVGALHPALVAERTGRLAAVAERAAAEAGVDPRYVIGTEVPVPGGESAGDHGIHVTTAEAVEETIELGEAAFNAAGVGDGWRRVRAVVAQPGVEFSDSELFGYRPGQAAHLARFMSAEPTMVLEAHSTDYQTPQALRGLVEDRFAILKVGPALTFAYREAVFALSFIEDELLGSAASGVREVLDRAMRDEPKYWQPFYPSDPEGAAYARRYSRSDRSRYYWPVRSVQDAVQRMTSNLAGTGIPDELLSQFLPVQSRCVASERFEATPDALMRDKVREVLDAYRWAAHGDESDDS
ncbi:MAG TPA: class II D-tagatose-bisphosphate aldolase, non-catalytic subunit [Actinomycetes bacterium]|nr:class II D-tagatose-bisphosphate aldolase, non-catalytic subunit [Actinomycetes bacterium]